MIFHFDYFTISDLSILSHYNLFGSLPPSSFTLLMVTKFINKIS